MIWLKPKLDFEMSILDQFSILQKRFKFISVLAR